MNVVRTELDLDKTDKRFPKKGTCMAIYSRCVNAREKLDRVLAGQFAWCKDWHDELRRLFDGVRGPQRGRRRARLRRPAALLARPAGRLR